MTNVMKGILSRILSQEIAHQEQWQKDDIERFGEDITKRDEIIEEIKSFMDENGIEFSDHFYYSV